MPDNKKHYGVQDGSRLCLQVTSGEVLGMAQNATTVTVMEKSRLRRKYDQSSDAGRMEQLSRLIIWNNLGFQTTFFLSG